MYRSFYRSLSRALVCALACACAFACLLPTVSAAPLDAAVIDYEAGLVGILQNDSRYGAAGTEFNASDVAQTNNVYPAQRLSLRLRFRARHEIRATYAPLDLTTRATLPKDVDFNGVQFKAGEVIDFRYLFDGTRLTYLYHLHRTDRLIFAVGGLFQLRNANVAISTANGERHAEESDIGPVGALSIMARYQRPNGLYGQLDAAGFSTFGVPNGLVGAVWDIALTLGVPVARGTELTFRLRYYGGGADVPSADLKNWAQLAFATIGLRLDLPTLLP
ncbi:MAG: hypothetical protein KC502_19690 [Myxococcales bacterium]|nr:hypothetical protein [Myxococcales bacterium]